MDKNISDGTHFQCFGTHEDHGLWVPGTHKKVNNFESLAQLSCHVQNFIAITSLQLGWRRMKFSSNFNYVEKIVREMGPWLSDGPWKWISLYNCLSEYLFKLWYHITIGCHITENVQCLLMFEVDNEWFCNVWCFLNWYDMIYFFYHFQTVIVSHLS